VAVEFNIEGQNYRFPDWATESTMEEVSKVLQEIAKNNGASDKDLKDLVANNKKMHLEMSKNAKSGEKSDKDRKEEAKEHAGFFSEMIRGIKGNEDAIRDGNKIDKKEYKSFATKVIDDFENTGEQLVGAVGYVGGGIFKAGMLLGGVAVTGAGLISRAMLGAGKSINDLTEVGLGFSSTYNDMGKTTTQAIGQLGALGDGFAGAAQRMANSSSVIATQGFGRFTDTMQFAADTSEELGLSFEASMDRFGQALDRRQAMLNLGNVDQGRLNKQVARTTRLQQAYSTAIGVSTTELQNFVSTLLDEGQLTATLIQFNDAVRSDVIGGIEVFASGMAAMGGKAGADLATAFQEAANTSAIGMSQAAIGMVTALPNLQGPMNEYIEAVQNGTLSQDQAQGMVENLTSTLGNLSHSEKQRIRAMANIGDESAKTMANAIAQFEQSESKMKDINKALGTGFKMDLVQKGTNQFNKVMAQISGGAQNAFYSLFSDPEVTGAISDGFKEILDIFGFGVDDMSGAAMSMGDRVGGMAKTLAKWIKVAADQLAEFANYLKDAFDEGGFGGMVKTLFGDMASAIGKAITKFVVTTMISIAAASVAKAAAMQMFTGKAQSGAAGAIADTIKNKVSGSGAKAVAGGMEAAGEKATGAMEGALTKGGKTGGFLQRIANGVKKFGDTKVLKGAAAIALLGASVGLAAVGLRTFNEVNFSSLVKGTVALGGLALLAKTLGKGSLGMVMGAAAIALLGAAVVPLAFGLSLMKDVGFKTIGVLAAGLVVLGLAAAGLSFISPFIIAGSIAIGALGLALVPLGIAMQLINEPLKNFGPSLSALADVDGGALMNTAGGLLAIGGAMALMAPMLPFMLIGALAGPAMERLADSLYAFNRVDMKNLSLAGGAMKSLGAGMSAISGGSLMSSVKDGIGGLFGADSPIEKIQKFIQGFKGLDLGGIYMAGFAMEKLTDATAQIPSATQNLGPFASSMEDLGLALRSMGDEPFKGFEGMEPYATSMGMFATSTEQLSNALYDMDLSSASDGFFELATSIHSMALAMDELSVGDILKLGALKMIGPSKQDIAKEHAPVEKPKPKSSAEKIYDKAMADGSNIVKYDLAAEAADRETEMANAIAEIKAENKELTAMVMVKGEGVKKLTSAEIKEGMDSGKISRSMGRSAQDTIKMREKAAQLTDDGTGKKSGTFKNGVLVPTPTSQEALNVPTPKTPYVPDEFEREMYGDDYDPAKAESGIVDVFEAYEKKFGESKSVFSTKQEDGTRFQIGNQPGNTVDNSTLLEPKGLGTGTNVDKEPFTSKVTPVEGGRKTNDDLKNEFANGMSSTTPASDPATMGMTEATGQQLVAVQQEQNALLKSQLRATKELNA